MPDISRVADIRRAFLEYFRTQKHTIVASSSLVPGNDPTLLFTNAGMVQFKDLFLGRERRAYVRATSSQRCVRAGGKHNDLENVGYTARHHTFFEMLGNFSFGDYFKREAITFAWEFVTSSSWLNIKPDRLMVTVYATDDEAYDIWHKTVGLPAERIVRIGDKPGGGSDNFWQMGDTGPCGPCTEIFYDHGPDVPGGPPGSADADGDRWIEIWNLVFMQFERAANGKLTPLPKPSVDTGMGLERVAAVMQGVHSNYEIDLFQGLIRTAAKVTGTDDVSASSLRVIADDIRACAFLILDGVLPSNEARGYVLRRIIRRAIRHGYQLGMQQPFFYRLVAELETQMGEAYPELKTQRTHIERILQQEEQRFAETLTNGMALLNDAVRRLQGTVIDGETVFKLYDTYGFPADLTADIARERHLTIDTAGFELAMQAQRDRARAASKFGGETQQAVVLDCTSEFLGYQGLQDNGKVVAIVHEGAAVQRLEAGQQGQIILDRTPFYAQSGGQVGDSGVLSNDTAEFTVTDTLKSVQAHAHIGQLLRGSIAVGDTLHAAVDAPRRLATALHHTATHLLHAALQEVLGKHVEQKGSLVAADRLRFDFSHAQAMTPEQVAAVERLVNQQIRLNAAVDTEVMPFDAAVAAGATALFGEKYGAQVRVLRIGEYSLELCGGTHAQRAGDLGSFKIVSEGGVAAGVRRIEAVAGAVAEEWVRHSDGLLQELVQLTRASRDDVATKVREALERIRQLEKEVRTLKDNAVGGQGVDLAASAVEVHGIKVIATQVLAADPAALRTAVDRLKGSLKSAVIVLASVAPDGKVSLVAGVTATETARLKAGDLVGKLAAQLGGKGGGRADMAQGGGSNSEQLPQVLASVTDWVGQQLGKG
jgi:alanyl-tRNA synthetase